MLARIRSVCFTIGCLVLALLLFGKEGLTQVVGGTLSGTISDSSGAVVPGAAVKIVNVATDVSRVLSSNPEGVYTVPNLLPGEYEVTVTAAGFGVEVRAGIALAVGTERVLNITLKVGQTKQTVQVTGAASPIQLANATLSNTVEGNTIRDIPLNGRDWTQLATLDPGIVSVGSLQASPSGNNRGNRGYGTQLSISGARPQQNNYRLDGISVNDYVNGGPGSVLGSSLGVDAIAEFSVLTSNYSAEYGRTSGGVINAITRSGTNGYHGDAFEFHRNSALDSANYFDRAAGIRKPDFTRNQFGGALGGPIRRGRTFFFGDYEGIRQSLGVTVRDTVLSQDARNGILHNPDGSTTTVTVDSLVKPFLPFWPLPNGTVFGNAGLYSVATQQVTHENFASGRLDHKISDKDNLSGSYQYDGALLTLPDRLNNTLIGNNTVRQFGSIENVHTFKPQFINNFRVGYNRVVALNAYGVRALNPIAVDTSLAAVPGKNAPGITVTGLTASTGGLNATSHYQYYWNSFQGYDDAFVTKGNHLLKFGGSVERIDFNAIGVVGQAGGFTFGSIQNFLTNQPGSFTSAIPSAVTPRNLRQSIFGAYVQDDIRWRPNLTVNLGIRYEMATVPTEVNNKLSNLRHLTDPTPHLGSPFFLNPTFRNFAPRVGFAWDPFSNGKTSVRGGFGMFDVLPLPYQYFNIQTSVAPFLLLGKASPLAQGDFPTRAFDGLALSPHLRTPYIEFAPHRSYVMQWNLNVQRELTPNLSAMMAYVGSRGVHQPFRADDINTVLPTLTPQGYLWPCDPGPIVGGLCSTPGGGTTLNPVTGRMDALTWTSNTFYDALELQLSKRLSHSFQVRGSYTWGKVIDEGSATTAGDPFQNSISSQFFFDRRLRRAVADFNIAQNLVVSFSWMGPSAKSLPRAASLLLGGWQVGGVYQIRNGLPFTPILGGDPLGLNSADPWSFPNRLGGPGCASAVNPGNVDHYIKLQCFSFPNPSTLLGNTRRNSLIGPGLANFDLSLFKNNYIHRISDTFNVQIRAEFFNILNRANFSSPIDNSILFDESGGPVDGAGALNATATTARESQLAVRLIW